MVRSCHGLPIAAEAHWGTAIVVRILIADDHAIVRSGLRAILETRSDFVVCAEARDGREAIDLTVQHKPDIAVIDFSLPILDGIEATRQIRLKSPQTEVLVLTAHDDELLISKALLAGARGFLLKMEANEQIVEAVTRLARQRPFITSN
jgi:DNA-binding NarL/FixJ family response regulator